MVQARNTNFSTDAQHLRQLGSPSAYVPEGESFNKLPLTLIFMKEKYNVNKEK
jgi:hypothetical protein